MISSQTLQVFKTKKIIQTYSSEKLTTALQTDELVETTTLQYFIEFKGLISDVLTFTLIMSKQMLSTFVPDLFILF